MFLVLLIILSMSAVCHAQTYTMTKAEALDDFNLKVKSIQDDRSMIDGMQDQADNLVSQRDILTANIQALKDHIAVSKKTITFMAKLSPALPEAVDYCNARPNNCINWP